MRAVIVRGAGHGPSARGRTSASSRANDWASSRRAPTTPSIAAALSAVQSIPVPVIAMISGLAVGGGCELAAACDVRIASSVSRFGIPIGELGVTLGLTETRAVAGVIGAANLKYLVSAAG